MRDQSFLKYFAIFWTLAGMAYATAITFFPLAPQGAKYADTLLGFIIGTPFALIAKWAFDSNYIQNHKDADPSTPTPTETPGS